MDHLMCREMHKHGVSHDIFSHKSISIDNNVIIGECSAITKD